MVVVKKENKIAVIIFPAYFDDSLRHATKHSKLFVVMDVLHLLNELRASTIDCVSDEKATFIDEIKMCLSFGSGGGTFDVFLLTVEKKALGGEHLIAEFNRKYKQDINMDPRAFGTLRVA
ncbi:Heat shock protein 70 family [Cynara cardunculus var. scolymus]|uniref:Heat shock protein 70 family n=1 Tax=Cynara cardunculus var. scolymus TaxID=59895 RepID=A0A103Y6N1_CYNCS|nr:Heat shock protein 70 family [Cynara cardunculus var. scolymus]